jgi:hypothetical protein
LEFVRSSRLFAFLSKLPQAICIAVVGNEEALELLAIAFAFAAAFAICILFNSWGSGN